MAYEDVFLMPISIHAPARGATPAGAKAVLAVQNFNSRPCERGDGLRAGQDFIQHYFNSRPCERGDAVPRLPDGCGGNFNSRPCERGDKGARGWWCYVCISIHAPARGATGTQIIQVQRTFISIHAPARGATAKLNKISVKFTEIIIKTEWEFKQYSSYGY